MMANLPLDEINYDLQVRVDEVKTGEAFPPNRFTQRTNRLAIFRRLWNGDLRDFVDSTEDVSVYPNRFRTVATTYADLLTAVEPTAAGLDELDLQTTCSQAVINAMRYGLSVTQWQPDEQALTTIDPTGWYPTDEGGHLIASAFTSAQAPDPKPDRIRITIIEEEGATESLIHEWDGRNLGAVIESEIEGPSFVAVVPMSPQRPGWGTSFYEDMLPLVFEYTKRLSLNSSILDKHSRPLLAVYITESGVDRQFGISPQQGGESDAAYEQRRQAALTKGLEGYLDHDIIDVHDDTRNFEYITWDGNIDRAQAQIDDILEELQVITRIPIAYQNQSAAPPSGIALKRLFGLMYATSRTIQNDIREALTDILGTTVVWPHVWDDEEPAPTPAAPLPEDEEEDEEEEDADVTEE